MSQLNQPSQSSQSAQPSSARRMRTPEAKAKRREQILTEASRIFKTRAYSEIRVQDIVAATGLAKGTFYLYFPTKEALFLALLLAELSSWFVLIQKQLETQSWTPAQLAQLLAQSIHEQDPLRQLLGLMHNVLEASLDAEAALRFKQELAVLMIPMATALEQTLPVFTAGDGGRFLLKLHALVVGLEQMTGAGPVLTEVMARPELSFMHPDFKSELEHTLFCLLTGWRS